LKLARDSQPLFHLLAELRSHSEGAVYFLSPFFFFFFFFFFFGFGGSIRH